jgi:opacity protein-like surface antigen
MFKRSALIIVCLMFCFGMTGATVCLSAEWYMQGRLGYEHSLDADFRDDHSSEAAADFFGEGNGENGEPLGAYGDFGDYLLAEFAVGRRMSAWLRIGIEAQYRWDMEYRGNANFLSVGVNQPVSAQARSLATMATVYWDINSHGLFQPYIGAGAGLAVNHVDKMAYRFPDNTGRHKISVMPSGDRQDAAFMVTGGTGVVLSDSIILDIAYRYQDLGRIGTDRGSMVMDILPEGIEVDATSAPLRTHGITAGLRFRF